MIVVAVQDIVRLECGCCYNKVGAGLVEGHRVGRCKDTYIGHNGGVAVVPAVALGRYIYNEAHMEVGLVFENGLGILRNLVVKSLGGIALAGHGGIVLTHGNTLSTTHTTCVVDNSFAIDQR